MTSLPGAYWASFERDASPLEGFLQAVGLISAYQAATASRFAWRGTSDAARPLHSSLVRAWVDKGNPFPMEGTLRRFEGNVLSEAREWNLDWHVGGGRLSALEMLAAMQHFGIPTRMLDFTFNPVIALWFAVQSRDTRPGRVFAIDVAGRRISPEKVAGWEPWWWAESTSVATEWATRPWVWDPPPLEPRMTRQEACFAMGGVPSTQPARGLRASGVWRPLQAVEVRECMSIPFQLIKYERAEAFAEGRNIGGAPAKASAFTLRIQNKAAIRSRLFQMFGYSERSLFPDLPGLAQYGAALN